MKQQNNTKTALIYAVDLLAIRPYSTQQLITKLKRKEYAPEEIQEVMDKYGLSKDMVFYYSNKKKVTKARCGLQVYLLKSEIDQFMVERATKDEMPPLNET